MPTKLKFLIGEKKLNATRFGANILQGDEAKLSGWVNAFKEMGLQAIHYNNLTGVITDTLAAQINTFLTATGADFSIHYPVENKTIKAEFPKYIDDLKQRFKIALLQLSNESLSTPEGMTNTEYIAESHKIISHVFSTPCSWDCGLLYRYPNKLHEARNEAIAKETGANEGRQYAQGVDILKALLKKGFTSDQTANVELIKTLTTELLPQLLEDYHSELPNLKKQNVLQTFLENAGENFLSGAVSNYGYGEYFRFFLANTESFSRVFWMSLGRHITKEGALEPEGISIKRISPAFKMRYVVPLEIKSLEGVTGIGFTDGVDNFSALLNTSTLTEPIINANEIKIFGKKITGSFINDCGGADSWNGTVENRKVTAAAITLVGCGVNWITFQTNISA